MTDTTSKFFVTAVIWTLCVGLAVSVVMVSEGNFVDETVIMMFIPLIIALFGTRVIWGGSQFLSRLSERLRPEENDNHRYEKAKRGTAQASQLDLLLSLLDDDEREIFKERLQQRVLDNMYASDGELNDNSDTLAALLDEKPRQHRY